MDAGMREDRRRLTSQRRARPTKPQRIYFPADGLGECMEVQPDVPLELCIEATDAHGIVVPWLTDEWWIRTHSFCKDRLVTVVILPTPGALLDPLVLHHFVMVRRIAPKWRIIGYAPCSDVTFEPDVNRWINTPYDEIRFTDAGAAPHSDCCEQAAKLAARATQARAPRGAHHARIRVTQARPDQFPPAPIVHQPGPPITAQGTEPLRLDQPTLVQST